MNALRAFLVAAAALAAMLGASGTAAARDVRIGTEAGFPPYSFTDRAGALRGFDIELGNEICRRAQLRCEWVVTEWETIIPELLSGEFDVILSGMAVTGERARLVAFSHGYETGSAAGSASLVRSDGSTSDAPTVGVQVATIHEDWARGLGLPVRSYPTLREAVEALFAGTVDEVIGPLSYIEGVERNGGDRIRVAETFSIPSGHTAAAFRKEDGALRETFDSVITRMHADGSIAAMAEKWFRAGEGTE